MSLTETFTKDNLKKFAIDMLFVCTGSAINAFATIGVMIPNGLTSGGVTGIVRMLEQFIPINFSVLYYIGSLIILVVCAATIGLKEAKKIALMTVIYPAFLVIFEQLNPVLLEQKDMTLAAIFYGVIAGIGCGLVFARGYSTGGSDTVAKIIKIRLLPHIAMSQILLCIDAGIVIISGFLFGQNVALYAIISSVIFTKTTEMILYGFDPKLVQLEIISDKHREIAEYIMYDIGRGISNVEITGEYTKEIKKKMITVCSPRESMLIKQFVAKIDRNVFVTVLHVETVWGRGKGFSDISVSK